MSADQQYFKEQKYLRRMQRKKEAEERAEAQRKAQEQQQRQIDEGFMRLALKQAKKAEAIGEVPIGCVIVRDGRVIARGYNRRNIEHSVFGHAEMSAIKKASKILSDWRLSDCTLYVTLEPCPMCSGACVQARVPRIVYGAKSVKSGCAGTVADLFDEHLFGQKAEIRGGVLEEECSAQLTEFFEKMRTGDLKIHVMKKEES